MVSSCLTRQLINTQLCGTHQATSFRELKQLMQGGVPEINLLDCVNDIHVLL